MNTTPLIAFIGGGNMATAIMGGLLRQGREPASILVIDPGDAQRERLGALGLRTQPIADGALGEAATVVWAVKPQQFKDAAQAVSAFTGQALHYSVMAGLRTGDMARWLGTGRIVRAMPNTPALVGLGVTGLFARDEVDAAERAGIEALVKPTGALLWVEQEAQLDAVTAMSGSGPAYVFYFIEAMMQAGTEMGLSSEQSRTLALATFAGATALASQSEESPAELREKVTSKGGTTYAALTHMASAGIKEQFVQAMQAARQRAGELGDEFGQ